MMALELLISGTDAMVYVRAGTITLTVSCDGSMSTLDFTLLGQHPASGGPSCVLQDGATTYFDGDIVSTTIRDAGSSGYRSMVTAQAIAAPDAATPDAPFDLSNAPNGSTTFPYRDLEIVDTAAEPRWHRVGDSISGRVTFWQPGMSPTDVFTLTGTGAGHVLSGHNLRVERLTTRWINATTPEFTAEFAETGGVLRPDLVTMVRWSEGSSYNGTQWVGPPHVVAMPTGDDQQPISATGNTSRVVLPLLDGSDIWIEDVVTSFYVSGGTALSGSHKWVGVISKVHASTSTTIATVTVDSGSSGTWRGPDIQVVDALMNGGTAEMSLSADWTKTGTPGTLRALHTITYRVVG